MVSSDYHLAEKKSLMLLFWATDGSDGQHHAKPHFYCWGKCKDNSENLLWNIVLLLDTGTGNQKVPLKSCHFYSVFCSTCIIQLCKQLSKWKNYLLTNALLDPALKIPFSFITLISLPRILISTCKTKPVVTWPFGAPESMVILSSRLGKPGCLVFWSNSGL